MQTAHLWMSTVAFWDDLTHTHTELKENRSYCCFVFFSFICCLYALNLDTNTTEKRSCDGLSILLMPKVLHGNHHEAYAWLYTNSTLPCPKNQTPGRHSHKGGKGGKKIKSRRQTCSQKIQLFNPSSAGFPLETSLGTLLTRLSSSKQDSAPSSSYLQPAAIVSS